MKTIVVKIGSSTLVRGGVVDEAYIQSLASQVAHGCENGWRTVIVSSGAIRVGLETMGRERAGRLSEKQAAAAVGQSLLMRAYRRAFSEHNIHVAQLLLTRGDLSDRRRFLNARHTLTQLFQWGVVPIVNENDTVATEEIRFGDNDTLASLTALAAEAHTVLLLSDVDGFYLPGEKKPLPVIEQISTDIEEAAGGAGSRGGTGGMKTKIEAARIATGAGIELVIAHGREPNVLTRVTNGESLGTRFVPGELLRGRKRWIAYGRHVQGRLKLNDAARAALVEKGASLLPIGVLEVEGNFEAGALVTLYDSAGEYARGLSRLSSTTLDSIKGRHSAEIASLLERDGTTVVVHRDDLTLTGR